MTNNYKKAFPLYLELVESGLNKTDAAKKACKEYGINYSDSSRKILSKKFFKYKPDFKTETNQYEVTSRMSALKKDGSLSYASVCQKCKYAYNVEYLKKKRQEPEFQAKERAYLLNYSSGVRKAHLKTNWEALRPQT